MSQVPVSAEPPAKLLDVQAVANMLDCSVRHVYRLSDTEQMPSPVKLGAVESRRHRAVGYRRLPKLPRGERRCEMNVSLSLDDLLTDEFQQVLQQAMERALVKVQPQLGQTEPDKLLLSADEAAERLSICAKSLWNYSQPRGGIPCLKIGTRTLYDPRDLEKWIDSQKQKGIEK